MPGVNFSRGKKISISDDPFATAKHVLSEVEGRRQVLIDLNCVEEIMDEKRERTQADKQPRNRVTLTDPSGVILQLARTCDLHRPPTLPSKSSTGPQLLLNSAAIDRLGELAIYLRSEKRWFKFPIHRVQST
jgi:hypothetical protein